MGYYVVQNGRRNRDSDIAFFVKTLGKNHDASPLFEDGYEFYDLNHAISYVEELRQRDIIAHIIDVTGNEGAFVNGDINQYTYIQLVQLFGVTFDENGTLLKGGRIKGHLKGQKVESDDVDQDSTDKVNHPSHYTDGEIEVIDYIYDKNLNFALGSAVKYISRAGKKEGSTKEEDLRKAIKFLEMELEKGEK